MTSGKVITCCGDCVHYNFKKHKCNIGHSAEIDPKEKFYADCTTFENVEEYERKSYNGAIDDFAESVKNLIINLSVIRLKDIDEIAEQLKGEK